jgi:hypothetical protein
VLTLAEIFRVGHRRKAGQIEPFGIERGATAAPRRRRAANVHAARREMSRLFQGDFAHEFGTHDFANIQALGRYAALLLDASFDFVGNRVEFFPGIIEGGHVFRFHH